MNKQFNCDLVGMSLMCSKASQKTKLSDSNYCNIALILFSLL